MKLLYKGFKNADEFLPDYIRRIGVQNGFRKSKIFEKLLTDQYYSSYKNSYDQMNKHAIRRLALEKVFKRNIPIDGSHRFNHSRRDIWSKTNKVCKKCLDSDTYTRFYWWFYDYQICHIHDELLLDGSSLPRENLSCRGNESLGPSVHVIVERYVLNEQCQNRIVDEIERGCYDLSIVDSLVRYFGECEVGFVPRNELLQLVRSGSLIGESAGYRIQEIIKVLEGGGGAVSFWLRVIALMICSGNPKGLNCYSAWSTVTAEYSRFCRYTLGMDNKFKDTMSKLKYLKAYKDMDQIDLEDILGEIPNITAILAENIRCSAFSCRHIKSWVSPIQKAEDFWDKKDLNRIFFQKLDSII